VSQIAASLVADEAELSAAYAVRLAVFVDEQKVPLDLERDELDDDADHAVGRLAGRIVATGRLVRLGNVGLVGRMAVLPAARARGLGSAVLAVLEDTARRRRLQAVELHAQVRARPFYERLGYAAFGEEYDEAGIQHISMRKPLS